MALLIGPWQRATDSANAVVSGAKLRIYDQGTTNLASVYTDEALTVPASNPLTADSGGWFELVYATQDALFDIRVETATGGAGSTPIKSWLNQPALGPESGSLGRDFTNGRFKASSTAGVVSLEAGDPSPDNTGGSMRLGGWADTQADDIEIDAAAVSTTGALSVGGALTTTGNITENSKKLSDIVQATGTWSAAASVEIELVNTPANCRMWEIDLIDITQSGAAATLEILISYDGTTYKTGVADYAWNSNLNTPGLAGTNDDADDSIRLYNAFLLVSNRPAHGKITVVTPTSGNNSTSVWGELHGSLDSAPDVHSVIFFSGEGLGNYGRAQKIKLNLSVGTMSGRYRVRPQRDFGE